MTPSLAQNLAMGNWALVSLYSCRGLLHKYSVSGTFDLQASIVSRYFDMENEEAVDQMEYTAEVQWPLNTALIPNYNEPVNPYTIANTTWVNRRK